MSPSKNAPEDPSEPKDDPYENTIFETLSSGGFDATLPLEDAVEEAAGDDEIGATLPIDAPGDSDGDGDAEVGRTMPVTDDLIDATTPIGGDTSDMPPSAPRVTDTLSPQSEILLPERVVPLERNRKIGNYRLDSWVGKGGQGEVWLGENVLASRKVALKFLHASLASDEQAMADLTGEAAVLFDLTHDRIVRLMNIEQASGHAFLVMEFLGGPSIQDVFKRRREAGHRGLTVAEALWILNEISQGLDYANDEGVTHRDIKPANMMLTAPVDDEVTLDECDARVKLCDFGIAFTANKSMAQKGEYNPIGTLPFMAPEVLMRQQPTPAADIYALGATLYYLVKGQPPIFGKMPARELIERIKADEPEPLQSGDSTFDAAIARALAKDPAERQASADELLREASGGRMGRVAQKAKTLRTAVLSAVSVALVATAVVAWLLSQREDQVKDFNFREGELTSRENFPVEALLDDPAVQQVEIGFRGGQFQLVGRSGDYFEATLPTPDRDGEVFVDVREPNGDRIYGSRSMTIDKTLAVEDVVKDAPLEPVAVEGGVDLRFAFDEEVRLEVIRGGAYADVGGERIGDGNQIRAHLDLSDAQASPQDLSQNVPWTLEFRATDQAGNTAEFEHVLDVYDREALLTRYADDFGVPAGPWSAWDLGGYIDDVRSWSALVRADKRLTQADRDSLLGGERGAIMEGLRETEKGLSDPTCKLFGDEVLPLGSGFRVYTTANSYTLSGRIEGARHGEVLLTEEGEEQPDHVALDADTNDFRVVVPLADGQERRYTISAPQLDPPVVVDIVQDKRAPEIATIDFDARTNRAPALVQARIVDKHLRSVWAVNAAGELRSDFKNTGNEAWELTALPLPDEGVHEFVLHAVDFAGNAAEQRFRIELDTTGPSFAKEEIELEARSGAEFAATYTFDQELEIDEAQLEVLGSDGRAEPWAADLFVLKAAPTKVRVKSEPLPDREGRVRVRFETRDALDNAGAPFEREYGLLYDVWGDFPRDLRPRAELVPVPEWAPGDWTPYVNDGGRRFPRCIRHAGTGLEFVYVPSGSFEFGSAESDNEEARQVTDVRMSGFYIARTEVSKRHFALGAGRPAPAGDADLPMLAYDYMGEEGVLDWCLANGFELPSEAQWEYAASGPDNRPFPWRGGFQPGRVHARLDATEDIELGPVDSLPEGASWCHALNMSGNVRELCRDIVTFSEIAELQDPLDPEGRGAGNYSYVLRGGGSRARDSRPLRTDARFVEEKQQSGFDFAPTLGFRPIWTWGS